MFYDYILSIIVLIIDIEYQNHGLKKACLPTSTLFFRQKRLTKGLKFFHHVVGNEQSFILSNKMIEKIFNNQLYYTICQI